MIDTLEPFSEVTEGELGEHTEMLAGLVSIVFSCDDLRSNISTRLGALGLDITSLQIGREQGFCNAPAKRVCLADARVSKLHALIERIGSTDYITDLGSKHGTWVNGEEISSNRRVMLNSGDRIVIGHTVLCYRLVTPVLLGLTVARQFGAYTPVAPLTIALVDQLERAACSTLPVLLMGERGAGKEFAARAIHDFGPRASKPFVGRNAGALAPSLIEAELFGAVRGAFTQAVPRQGALASAHTGTIFLDEIANMPAELQPRLHRVLTTSEIVPVGADASRKIDIRWVTATNVDIYSTQRLMEDLRDRFSAIRIKVPSLLDRFEDLGPFFQHIFSSHTHRIWMTIDACRLLTRYTWPGNFREIESSLLGALALLRPEQPINTTFLPTASASLLNTVSSVAVASQSDAPSVSRKRAEKTACPPVDVLKHHIEQTSFNVAAMAKRLGVPERSLRRWLDDLGLFALRHQYGDRSPKRLRTNQPLHLGFKAFQGWFCHGWTTCCLS